MLKTSYLTFLLYMLGISSVANAQTVDQKVFGSIGCTHAPSTLVANFDGTLSNPTPLPHEALCPLTRDFVEANTADILKSSWIFTLDNNSLLGQNVVCRIHRSWSVGANYVTQFETVSTSAAPGEWERLNFGELLDGIRRANLVMRCVIPGVDPVTGLASAIGSIRLSERDY